MRRRVTVVGSVCVCLSVYEGMGIPVSQWTPESNTGLLCCLLSHISPLVHLFVLKVCTQQATEVKNNPLKPLLCRDPVLLRWKPCCMYVPRTWQKAHMHIIVNTTWSGHFFKFHQLPLVMPGLWHELMTPCLHLENILIFLWHWQMQLVHWHYAHACHVHNQIVQNNLYRHD